MAGDSITEEIRDIRRDLAAQFGNDPTRILADIRQREASDGRTYVSLSPRATSSELNQPPQASESTTGTVSKGESSPPIS
jgi:hypothetical protein